MEIYKMMVMSSGHISGNTMALLTGDNAGVVVYQKDDYGWFLVVTDWQDNIECIPCDLQACLSLAEENGCDWLCIDHDGRRYENPPWYD